MAQGNGKGFVVDLYSGQSIAHGADMRCQVSDSLGCYVIPRKNKLS